MEPSDIDGRAAETPGELLWRLIDIGIPSDYEPDYGPQDRARIDAIAAQFKAAVLAGQI